MADPVLSSLIRIHHLRVKKLKQGIAPYGYVGIMHLIVIYLGKHPGVSQEEIAGYYSLDKTTVSRDARRLEDMGHIERRTAPENRRQYELYLTEAGREMIPILEANADRFAEEISQGFTPEEWETLGEMLERVKTNCFPPLAADPEGKA